MCMKSINKSVLGQKPKGNNAILLNEFQQLRDFKHLYKDQLDNKVFKKQFYKDVSIVIRTDVRTSKKYSIRISKQVKDQKDIEENTNYNKIE